MEFETVIGLEIHAQMKTGSKIFCGCSTEFGAPPNTHTCPVCLGMPGSLPVLNKRVLDFAIKVGLSTNSRINPISQFARKNYFYPDLPKGYQTSQYDKPIIEDGHIDIEVDGQQRRIGITRIHMEEDAGKLIHDEREPVSYVDLNRTGTPLLEIVSEPDLRSPKEASAYLKKIHAILRYLDVCDGNMQEGSFRCDANISLRPIDQQEFGTRTELKNMNSFRNVQAALEYEVRRQRDLLLEKDKVVQQTLLWNPDTGKTEPMRGKEDAHDYRYFPCPDLIPVEIDEQWIEEIREGLPELPDQKRQRFIDEFSLPDYDAIILTESKELADYFEAAVEVCPQPKKVSNWMMTELLRELKGAEIDQCLV
ncbi:MAG: Asp-tRNA(Asn)/Glu-tRNA(Gln) amidotransferase subunit GatB, partial [Desulfofustis sp.]|nr:Asp-tRNA(Asn)/Glu-tRNA(Gln) amidotransferase subunit GatB [Desulfofustis sp.]